MNIMAGRIFRRNISETRSPMEEYFKDKHFIVTGASAGKYHYNYI